MVGSDFDILTYFDMLPSGYLLLHVNASLACPRTVSRRTYTITATFTLVLDSLEQ